jgi:DNA polymerase-3 subunit delta'
MFTNLIGNNEAKEGLRRMLAAGRVPGGLLFTGEDGIGKKLFALELAKALNCRTRVGVEACDQCSSCKRITQIDYPATSDKEANNRIIRTRHADVGLVRPPTRFLLVSQMRDIEREANFRPYEGLARVFLIEDADRMNESAANALLKTLEEPPTTSFLILITSQPAALLPTIRSRCQAIYFAPIPAAEIEKFLVEEKAVAPRDAALLARTSRGSIGRALATDAETYREQREAMLLVVESLVLTGDRVELLRSAEGLNDAKRKDEYECRLDVLESVIRDAWALALHRPEETIANADQLQRLRKIAADMHSHKVGEWLLEIEKLREQLIVNINRKIATDALFLSMASK